MMRIVLALVAVLLAGCGGSKPAPTVTGRTPVVGYILKCSDGSTQYALAIANDVNDWPPREVCK